MQLTLTEGRTIKKLFMLAMAAYQKRARRRFPTWREVLHVARCLGYRKVADPVPVDEPKPPETEADTAVSAPAMRRK